MRVEDQLCDGSLTADAGRLQRIQFRTDPIKRPKQGKFQPFFLAVGPNYAVEQLFTASVNPAQGSFNKLDLVSRLKFNLKANRELKTVLNICKKRLFVKFFNPMISLVGARNAFGFSGRNQMDLTSVGYFSIVRSMNTNNHQRNP